MWKVIPRNKRTITLNFSTPEEQELLRRQVADADVLVENLRPETVHRGRRSRFEACNSEGSSGGRPHAKSPIAAMRPAGTGFKGELRPDASAFGAVRERR